MEYKNEDLGAILVLPDKFTILKILDYDSRVELEGYETSKFERLWNGVKVIAEKLECDYCSLTIDLENATDMRAIDVIKWAGIVTFSHVAAYKQIPKN